MDDLDRKEDMLDSLNILIEIADWLDDKSYKEDLEEIKSRLEAEVEEEREQQEKQWKAEREEELDQYWKTRL